MDPLRYSIKDLERITGIRAHTIRIWEKRYGIVNPERTSSNIRFYSDQHLQKLLNISILNRHGFKISEISELTDSEIISEVSRISDSSDDSDVNINDMILAAIDLQEDQFEKALNSSILKLGFERTFCDVVFPFLEKISVFWQIGRINACQERFVNNLVKQKLLVAIDGFVGQLSLSPRKFLLYLPSGEYNETGLLFANYLIRKSGHQLVYLGPSVPLDHLNRIPESSKFDELVLTMTQYKADNELPEYLRMLRKIFPEQIVHIIIPGEQHEFSPPQFEKVKTYFSFTQFSSELG